MSDVYFKIQCFSYHFLEVRPCIPLKIRNRTALKKKLETKIIILQFRQRSPHQKYIVLKHKKNDIAQYRVERQMLNFSAKI